MQPSTRDAEGEAVPFAPRTYRLARTDDKDLQFDGYLIGQAKRSDPLRSVHVSIYATVGGKYVTHIERSSSVFKRSQHPTIPWPPMKSVGTPEPLSPGIPVQREAKAGVHETPEAAFSWLVADNNGKLGQVSKLAWEEACRSWPALRGQDVEVVE